MQAQPFNRYDALKLLALMAMIADHVGAFLFPQALWLRVIGRIAAPLFCFLVGWNGQYRFRKELLVAALLVSALEVVFHALLPLNILWMILLGRVVMARLDASAKPESPVMMVLVCAICVMSVMLVEYGSLAMLWMLWGRSVRRQPGGRESWVYALAAMVLGLAFTLPTMGYTSLWQHAATCVLFVMLTVGLQRFSLHTYARPHPLLKALARRTLALYVLQFMLLFGIGVAMGTIMPGLRLIALPASTQAAAPS